jgi:hypothetical protein
MPENRDRSRTSGKVVLMECHRRSEHFPVGAKKKVILFPNFFARTSHHGGMSGNGQVPLPRPAC